MFKYLALVFFVVIIGFDAQSGVNHVLNYQDPQNGGGLQGWDGPLSELKNQLDSEHNYALFVIHKPKNAFILNNLHLFRQTVYAAREDLEDPSVPALGHVQVGWACHYPGQRSRGRQYGFTGQSGEHGSRSNGPLQGQGSSMLLDGRFGMTLFFTNFRDGNLESAEYSAARLVEGRSDFVWLAVKISQQDCHRGLKFLDKYISAGAYNHFSFFLDPKKYQGGGCTSFGSTLAAKLGMFSQGLVEAWNRPFLIPKSLVGNPDGHQFPEGAILPNWVSREDMPRPDLAKLPLHAEVPRWLWGRDFRNNLAGPGKLLLSPFPGIRGHLKTRIYDPELIILTIKSIAERLKETGMVTFPSSFDLSPRRAYGLTRGANGRLKGASSSTYIELDGDLKSFPSMRGIRHYIQSPRVSSPEFRLGRIGKTYGVILEKATW